MMGPDVNSLLSRLRRSAGISQVRAGEIIQSGRAVIQEIEAGRREVTLNEMLLLMQGYGMPIMYGLTVAVLDFKGKGHQLCPEDRRLAELIAGELSREGSVLKLLRGDRPS